jgi:hypothetical protein
MPTEPLMIESVDDASFASVATAISKARRVAVLCGESMGSLLLWKGSV